MRKTLGQTETSESTSSWYSLGNTIILQYLGLIAVTLSYSAKLRRRAVTPEFRIAIVSCR